MNTNLENDIRDLNNRLGSCGVPGRVFLNPQAPVDEMLVWDSYFGLFLAGVDGWDALVNAIQNELPLVDLSDLYDSGKFPISVSS